MVQYLMAYMTAKFEVNEEGQGLVEYALILALIAIVVAAALLTLEDQITATFTAVTAALGGGGA